MCISINCHPPLISISTPVYASTEQKENNNKEQITNIYYTNNSTGPTINQVCLNICKAFNNNKDISTITAYKAIWCEKIGDLNIPFDGKQTKLYYSTYQCPYLANIINNKLEPVQNKTKCKFEMIISTKKPVSIEEVQQVIEKVYNEILKQINNKHISKGGYINMITGILKEGLPNCSIDVKITEINNLYNEVIL